MAGWIASFACTRAEAEGFSIENPALEALADPPVIVARELDEFTDNWQVDAYFNDAPSDASIALLLSLVPSFAGQLPLVNALPDEDWVTISQQGLQPVLAGRFYVHTDDNIGTVPPGARAFAINAGLAFGTGGHATTTGCLEMIDRLARRGHRFANIADIGTGTGLLAFAALHLWPRAHVIASDIDPVSVAVTIDNARHNRVPLGRRSGAITAVVAAGTRHPSIARRAPFDLVIANILAGPLVALAPDFAAVTRPGSHLILAGLIGPQAGAVIAAYRACGFRLTQRRDGGDWPCLLLVRRAQFGWQRRQRATHRGTPSDASFGSW